MPFSSIYSTKISITMKNSICLALLLLFFFSGALTVSAQAASKTGKLSKPATTTTGTNGITQPKTDRGLFEATAGYMTFQGKQGRDTANTAFALGLAFGRRMVAKDNFTFESLGNFDVLQFTGSGTNDITRRLGGSTLFNPQFGFRITNGQIKEGKRLALGLKLAGGIATNVQSILKFNFKGISPDLTLAASPSIALMLGGSRYLGCQLDLSYIGKSNALAEGLKKGFFVTPKFSFQF